MWLRCCWVAAAAQDGAHRGAVHECASHPAQRRRVQHHRLRPGRTRLVRELMLLVLPSPPGRGRRPVPRVVVRSGRLLACSAAEKTTEEDENALEGEGASADYNRRTMEGAQLLLEQRAAKAQQGGRRGERRQWSILWPYYLFSRDDGSSRMVSKVRSVFTEICSGRYAWINT
ncbi:hypothetical protein ZEAMMB73_Zm00001d013608 [Zea mays]|uniref:Uncharacterized protein n=2 Tax=Zea mays TaxID=4577 RepID=A0A1D6GKY1_MAIZE|nr:hypothetical protein ZEAMMB73_Zm00001d013608 [Zea mays]